MGVLNYTIQFYSDWHCGSGLAAGADVDALAIKDKDGLPYVPGKTIKGLVREVIEDFYKDDLDFDRLFGKSGDMQGALFFSNAVISEDEKKVIVKNKWQKNLYRSLASTAIDSNGIAVEHSLRKIEVAIPMILTGRITGCDENEEKILIKGLGLIKRLGSNRSRGLGRCDIVKIDESEKKGGNGAESQGILKFKCTLLSDVVLNQKSASEGANSTLDFIPGNCFLGIAAAKLYSELEPEDSLLVFHSGKVRFGDAHPLVEGIRALRTPACMYYPKLEDEYGKNLYISHEIERPDSEDMRKLQLKQCRSGFYAFAANENSGDGYKMVGYKAANDKSFALKSARDKEKLRSADSQMYGYESLSAGQEFCFEVEMDESVNQDVKNAIKGKIIEALVGVKHIGRSRSSQYGEVRIEECNYIDIESGVKKSNDVVVYADGRLIFIDKNSGLPTFRPAAEDLGFKDGEIDWEKSQIRTFQYAPWNGVRKCFDTDRCGIEKGGVFVVTGVKGAIPSGSYVGSYRNEGFGRIIYNPGFLDTDKAKGGKANVRLKKHEQEPNQDSPARINTILIDYLKAKANSEKKSQEIYKRVNAFVKDNAELFKGKEEFASQWGTIRSYAMSSRDNAAILKMVEDYIGKGVKKGAWADHGRDEKLGAFMRKPNSRVPKDDLRESLINLASVMAKECKPEKNNN